LLTFTTFGQKAENLFTFSYSNNGQIYDVIDEFYFSQGAYLPNNDVFTYNQSDVKFNFQYEYLTPKDYSFYCKVGYSNRYDTYTISNVQPANGSKEQNYENIALGVKYTIRGDHFEFSTGLEIPYFKVSTYTEKLFWNSPTQPLTDTQTLDGGSVYGLNSVYSMKVFISKTVFISTDLVFGLLYFNLGGMAYQVVDYLKPPAYTTTEPPYIETYKKTTVSKPEFSFGLGIKL
jgi:hypothetical protein